MMCAQWPDRLGPCHCPRPPVMTFRCRQQDDLEWRLCDSGLGPRQRSAQTRGLQRPKYPDTNYTTANVDEHASAE